MKLESVSFEDYNGRLKNCFTVFGNALFNQLNSHNAERVLCFLFKDTKYRLGIIGGIRDHIFYSPFSAPFGGFSYFAPDVSLSHIEASIRLLDDWALEHGIHKIKLTLPPSMYGHSFIAKMYNVLYRENYQVSNLDLNYAFPASKFNNEYSSLLWRNARKNLSRALVNDLIFFQCSTLEEKRRCYEIIAKNRELRGFPIRMSWEQVHNTVQVISAEFFMVLNNENTEIAAAIVFVVAPKIVQVVYWGDLPEFSFLKTMNFLSYKIFEYYSEKGFSWIDIGPSTENSLPNYGLCEFKESIGCEISEKLTFTKELNGNS